MDFLSDLGLKSTISFDRVALSGADLPNTNLSRIIMPDSYLSGADLSGADLSGAILEGATLLGITYDEQTIWPEGFTPPPSRQP